MNLLDYATNEVYTFRGNLFYTAVERIASRASAEVIFTLFEALLVKQSAIYDRPMKIEIDEEGTKELNSQLSRRIFNTLKILLENLIRVQSDLSYDRFALILQAMSHPVTCKNKRSLKMSYAVIEKLITKEKLVALFETNCDRFVEQFLRRRTGIMSENKKVRQIAKNVLVMVAWAGQLEAILPHMVPIFEYKPIQMLNKMEQLL